MNCRKAGWAMSAIAFTAACALTSCTSSDDVDGDEVEEVKIITLTAAEMRAAQINSDFQIDMFADFTDSYFNSGDDAKENVSMSPLSASLALSILANCVDDSESIQDIMNCDDLASLNSYNSKIMLYLPVQNKSEKMELANGLWYDYYKALDAEFVRTMQDIYGLSPEKVDFSSKKTVDMINDWVSNKTHGQINKVVEDIDPLTVVILANAMYYKGEWAHPFDKKNTMSKAFYGITDTRKVPTMYQRTEIGYACVDDAQIGKFDFKSKRMSLYVILPPKGDDVVEYAIGLDATCFNDMVSALKDTMSDVYLPKFKTENNFYLDKYLENKGLNDYTNLMPMGIDKTVSVNFCQKTSFEVDEEGATAAAVTTDFMVGSTGPFANEFDVCRPFIYILRENTTGAVLMAGVIRQL